MARQKVERRIARSIEANRQLQWMSRWFTPKELEADVAALLDDGAITDVGTAVRYYEDFLVLTEAALRRSPAATIALLVGRPS